MILSDGTIKTMVDAGELKIDPLKADHIQPASLDCTLGSHFLKIKDSQKTHLDFDTPIEYESVESTSIVIPPQSFLLATTREYIALPNDITAFVEGRSSIGRMGLFIQNAGWVDAGFECLSLSTAAFKLFGRLLQSHDYVPILFFSHALQRSMVPVIDMLSPAMIICQSAMTAAFVEYYCDKKVTLFGFCRKHRFNQYSNFHI